MTLFSSFERTAQRLSPLAATVLRVALAWVFLRHGLMKLHMGLSGVAGFLHSLGFPLAGVCAVLLIIAETFGAACVAVGLLTRFFAACLALDMILAIWRALLPSGRPFELEGMLLAGALALVFLGDGWLALGSLIGKKKEG
ncbi:MAG TPA: DoxX family protein [Gemmatimonadales bacterium]|nr:DoxX family protein [Gemmatimonadales bacterium]